MQPARRWGRPATVLIPRLTKQTKLISPRFRFASSIPKRAPSAKRPSDYQREVEPRRKKNGHGDWSPTLDQDARRLRDSAPRALPIHDDREIIDPLSLERTLQAHQQANRESIIIRHTRSTAPVESGLKHEKKVPTESAHLDLEREDVQSGRGPWEDYTGAPRPLSLDWEIIGGISRNLSLPWLSVLGDRQLTRDLAAARLSEEIRAADQYFSPSQAEREATHNAVKTLENFVLKADLAHVKLDIIGSRASGLATPLSDLDLNLVVAEQEDEETSRRKGQNPKLLANLFRTMKWGKNNKRQFSIAYYAAHARVPIIVGTHLSGLEFQIQSASSCYGSLEVVKHLCAEYPTLRALFKLIKQSLKMRGLSDGHLGGLTSYPLINMITVSLKRNAKTTDDFDYGKHLIQFLEYWSTIDLYTTGITHLPSSYLTRTGTAAAAAADPFRDADSAARSIDLITQDPVGAKPIEFDVRKDLADIHEGQNNFMMTLHDPANPHNDLGRSVNAIKHVQATFMDMLAKLKSDMSEWDRQIRANGDAGKNPPSLLRSLIEGDYSLYNMERKRITAHKDLVTFGSGDVKVDATRLG